MNLGIKTIILEVNFRIHSWRVVSTCDREMSAKPLPRCNSTSKLVSLRGGSAQQVSYVTFTPLNGIGLIGKDTTARGARTGPTPNKFGRAWHTHIQTVLTMPICPSHLLKNVANPRHAHCGRVEIGTRDHRTHCVQHDPSAGSTIPVRAAPSMLYHALA